MIFRFLIAASLLTFLTIGCAWENYEPGETNQDRIWEVKMVMEGSINPNWYYFIVFNFSGDINQKPIAAFDGLDRGRYWDVYYLYGKPGDRPEVATEPLGFYKGEGTGFSSGSLPLLTDEKKRRKDPVKPKTTNNPLDILPVDFNSNEPEFVDARITSSEVPADYGGGLVSNNTIYIKFNWRGFPQFPAKVNMNMIVSTLGIDFLSNDPNDDLEALVWDSFAFNGVSLPLTSDDLFEEKDFLVEVKSADQIVPGRPPSANIVDWSVRIIK